MNNKEKTIVKKIIKTVAGAKTNFSILGMVRVCGRRLLMSNMDSTAAISIAHNLEDGMYNVEDIINWIDNDITPKKTPIPTDDFPDIPAIPIGVGNFMLNIDDYMYLQGFASDDTAQYTLNGTLLTANEMVAIDGRRLAKKHHNLESFEGREAIVSRDFLTHKLGKSLIAIGPKRWYIRSEILGVGSRIELSGELLQGKFPNWRMFIPEAKESKSTFSVNKYDLLEFFKVSKSQRNKDSNAFYLDTSHGRLRMKHDEDSDNSRENTTFSISCELASHCQLRLNFKILEDIIKNSEDRIVFRNYGQVSPVRIGEDFIIMPMKFNEDGDAKWEVIEEGIVKVVGKRPGKKKKVAPRKVPNGKVVTNDAGVEVFVGKPDEDLLLKIRGLEAKLENALRDTEIYKKRYEEMNK